MTNVPKQRVAISANKRKSENEENTLHCDVFSGSKIVRFGEALYQLRSKAGVSQANMARQCGVARGYYSQLENSKRLPPPPKTVDRFCSAFLLSAADSKQLHYLADAERCGMVVLPEEMPKRMAELFRQLAEKLYHLTPDQLSQVCDTIEEVIAM